MTGVNPRYGEDLAQSEVEYREGRRHARVLFYLRYPFLHLGAQTCVGQRKHRLRGMATSGSVNRLQEKVIIWILYDIAPQPIGHWLGTHKFGIANKVQTVGV